MTAAPRKPARGCDADKGAQQIPPCTSMLCQTTRSKEAVRRVSEKAGSLKPSAHPIRWRRSSSTVEHTTSDTFDRDGRRDRRDIRARAPHGDPRAESDTAKKRHPCNVHISFFVTSSGNEPAPMTPIAPTATPAAPSWRGRPLAHSDRW